MVVQNGKLIINIFVKSFPKRKFHKINIRYSLHVKL